jgi:hypothetical protein
MEKQKEHLLFDKSVFERLQMSPFFNPKKAEGI